MIVKLRPDFKNRAERKLLDSAVDQVVQAFEEKNVVPFVGAGISFPPPSCVSLASTIQDVLVENLVQGSLKFLDKFEEKEKWEKTATSDVTRLLSSFMLEKIIEHTSDIYGEKAIKDPLVKALNRDKPNTNHVSLATLLKKKQVPTIINYIQH